MSDLVERAAAHARTVHADDVRKGTGESYFDGHLHPVAELVRQAGGTDVQIAGAYLHDAAEDGGGQAQLDVIAAEFGDDVAAIVRDLSDSLVDTRDGATKPPWSERKQAYIASLATKPASSLEVAAADKLHNSRSIVDDLRTIGDTLWERFNEHDPHRQLWYYRSLADTISEAIPDWPLANQLVETVDELEALINASPEA